MPGNSRSPISGERGGITTSASPEARLKSSASTGPASSSSRRPGRRSFASAAIASGSPRTSSTSPTAICPSPHRSLVGPAHGDERHARLRQIERRSAPAPTSGDPSRTRSWCIPVVEPELLDQRPRVVAQVRRQRPALAHRQQPLPEHDRDEDGRRSPAERRPARTRNSRTADRPASSEASSTSTFTGVPVSASIEPACAPNTSGIRSCDGGRFSRTAITTTTGSSAATAPLTLISAESTPTNSIISDDQPPPALPGAANQHLPGPGGDAGLLERRARDEQRRDEHRRRVAEARRGSGSASGRRSPRAPARSRCRPRSPAAGPRRTGTITDGDDGEDDPDVGSCILRRGAPPEQTGCATVAQPYSRDAGRCR